MRYRAGQDAPEYALFWGVILISPRRWTYLATVIEDFKKFDGSAESPVFTLMRNSKGDPLATGMRGRAGPLAHLSQNASGNATGPTEIPWGSG